MTSCPSDRPQDGRDPDSFDRLFRDHAPRLRKRVYARLYVQVRRCWPVDDTLQEIWLAAWRSWPRFEDRGPGSRRRWLNGIARFKELDALRRFHRSHRHNGGSTDDVPEPPAPPQEACPFTRAERNDLLESIHACIARLCPSQREAYLLVRVQGQSTRRAGRILDRSAGATGKLVYRAEQKLIRWLGERY